MDVSVVHLGSGLLDRQLDPQAALLLQRSLEARGLKFLMPRQTEALLGNEQGRVRALRFAGGEEVEADLVVMAVGIRPNTELAESCGLSSNSGVEIGRAWGRGRGRK